METSVSPERGLCGLVEYSRLNISKNVSNVVGASLNSRLGKCLANTNEWRLYLFNVRNKQLNRLACAG